MMGEKGFARAYLIRGGCEVEEPIFFLRLASKNSSPNPINSMA